MKKSLPIPIVVGLVAVALIIAGVLVIKPAMSPAGPDASQVHVSAEEIARQRANPPQNEPPLPQYEGPVGGMARPTADSGRPR